MKTYTGVAATEDAAYCSVSGRTALWDTLRLVRYTDVNWIYWVLWNVITVDTLYAVVNKTRQFNIVDDYIYQWPFIMTDVYTVVQW